MTHYGDAEGAAICPQFRLIVVRDTTEHFGENQVGNLPPLEACSCDFFMPRGPAGHGRGSIPTHGNLFCFHDPGPPFAA